MDLDITFNVSQGSRSNIFLSWLRAMAEYFKAFVFIPNLETVLASSPDRFRCFKNLIGIIDCTEVFIETPKSLELQSATWSTGEPRRVLILFDQYGRPKKSAKIIFVQHF